MVGYLWLWLVARSKLRIILVPHYNLALFPLKLCFCATAAKDTVLTTFQPIA